MLTAPSAMTAVRWHGRGDVRVERTAAPVDPRDGMAVVEVACCGICGTDVGEYRSGPFLIRADAHPLTGQAPPVTLGHELAGVVVAAGAGVHLPVGARVTVDACWRCGTCPACQRGDYHLCRHGGSIGIVSDGGFASHVTVPAYTLVELPASVTDEQGALTEPLAVALHALDRGGARAGDDVLVLGFGPIGAAVALVARTLGMRPVVVEAAAERSGVAASMGFAVLEPQDELPRALRRLLGRYGADVVVECTGVPQVLAQAIACTDRGGTIVPVGLAKAQASIDPSSLVLYERSLAGSLGYRHDLPRVVSMIASGALDPTPLISERISLREVPAMLERLATDPGARIKVMVGTTDDRVDRQATEVSR